MDIIDKIPVLRQLNPYLEDLEKQVSVFIGQKIGEHLLSYFLCDFKVKKLKKTVEDLREIRDKMQQLVDEEYRNGKDPAEDILKWLKQVDNIIDDVREFWHDKRLPFAMCSLRYLPKPGLRYPLAKEAYRLAREVDILSNTSFLDRVSSVSRPMSMDFVLSVVNFESFNSRKKVTEGINKALEDITVKVVGVYGTGGVGKTTLVKKAASTAKRKKLFDVVIFATVTRNPDIKQIQGQLAGQLGVRLDEETEIGRASRLRDIFKKQTKKTLVILDDLWVGADLNKLGIPVDDVNLSPSSTQENSKREGTSVANPGPNFTKKNSKKEGTSGVNPSPSFTKKNSKKEGKSGVNPSPSFTKKISKKEGTSLDEQVKKESADKQGKKEATGVLKILLTSRNKEVVVDQTQVKENSSFIINGLEDLEAEILFKKMVGMVDNKKPPEFEPLAVKISKKCGGLPVAIVTMGKALRTKSCSQWKEALGQLERQEFTEVAESVDFSTRLSFNYLENEELKSFFLLCAQLGYNPLMMDLVKYCIGLGIFEGFLTIKETREKVLRWIEKLKDSSLLSDNYSNDRFNMHDLIREIALSIASKEQHYFIRRNGEIKEWPHENEFEKYNGISIRNCYISDELSDSVRCPNLKIFHVESLNPSWSIPKEFFQEANQLRALILTGIDVSEFCASIERLTNLRMLCLENCKLKDISYIGKLTKLRILSLAGSRIERISSELSKLHKLQLLDLSNLSEPREIPPNALSSLSSLEELYMGNSVIWKDSILAELRHLHQLKKLDIRLQNVAALPRNLFLNKLDSYSIFIGDSEVLDLAPLPRTVKEEASRVLALEIEEPNAIHNQEGVKMLFRGVEKLYLGKLNGVKNIFYEFNFQGFPCLKELFVQDNSDIEYIIDSKDFLNLIYVFPILESLDFVGLKNLKKISRNTNLSEASFSRLKVVKISCCDQLENVFMPSMIESIETIDISNCKSMKTMVPKEKPDLKIKFAKLRFLKLADLDTFTGVYSNNDDFILFNEEVEMPNLESLELSSMRIKEITSQSKPSESLTKLNVTKCDGMEYLFSFSLAKSMKQLKSLSLSECAEMVEIFKYADGDMHKAREVRVFPNLEEIRLQDMDKLTEIWPRESNSGSFSSLNSISIRWSDRLVTVFPSHMVGRFSRLESLEIESCSSVEQIFDLSNIDKKPSVAYESHLKVIELKYLEKLEHIWNEDPRGILNFKRLRSVAVYSCDELKYLFPVSVAGALQELDSLSVGGCDEMEEIIIAHGDEGLNNSTENFEFPQLSVVEMRLLPNLICFYKGKHNVKWPKLKKLSLYDCDSLEAFKTETQNSEGGGVPMFLLGEIIPNLETMVVRLEEAAKLNLCINNYYMNHLKHFCVVSCPSNVEILYQFLCIMPCLEKLEVSESDITELIPIQENSGTFLQLKYLGLRNLESLENIGFERRPALQYCLEELSVRFCDKLINLGPSSVIFTHLTTLDICYCRGMKNLMEFSTAKSLVQLVSLKVRLCVELEEIVAGHQSDEVYQDKIVFSKLMTLSLVLLPKLSCFCSCEILEFPALEKLEVSYCSMMKKFCNRECTAARLQVTENWSWDGNLNGTMKMFLIKLSTEGEISFSEDDVELARIWRPENPLPVNSFGHLEKLVVENCESEPSTVIPSHLIAYLPRLEQLEVRNCSSVVAIFDVEVNDKVIARFPKLTTMTLHDLPNMKHVWSKNPKGIIMGFEENLEEVEISGCDSLQTLFPAASITKSLEKLTIENCGALEEIVGKAEAHDRKDFEFSCLEYLTLRHLPKLKHVWSNNPEGIIMGFEENIKEVEISGCDSLQTLFPTASSITKSLTKLTVRNCGALEEIVGNVDEDIIEFPSLESLTLVMLPKLKSGTMKPTLCPSVTFLNVDQCGECSTESQIFTSESQSYQGPDDDEDKICTSNDDSQSFSSPQQLSICSTDGSPSNHLDGVDLAIWLYLPGNSFKHLETLVVENYKFDAVIPSHLLIYLSSLKQLEVRNSSSVVAIFGVVDDKKVIASKSSKLERMILHDLPNMKHVWINNPEDIIMGFEENLKEVEISGCDSLQTLFPAASITKSLEILTIKNCKALEEIVGKAEAHDRKDLELPCLEYLTLHHLPKLKHVWSKNPEGIISYENLEEVKIFGCDSLQTLFPAASMTKSLTTLAIAYCGALEEIVRNVEAHDDDEEAAGAFKVLEFPCLEDLILGMLPKLKSSTMKLLCPSLTLLFAYGCAEFPKSQVFTSESQSYQGEDLSMIHKPFSIYNTIFGPEDLQQGWM